MRVWILWAIAYRLLVMGVSTYAVFLELASFFDTITPLLVAVVAEVRCTSTFGECTNGRLRRSGLASEEPRRFFSEVSTRWALLNYSGETMLTGTKLGGLEKACWSGGWTDP